MIRRFLISQTTRRHFARSRYAAPYDDNIKEKRKSYMEMMDKAETTTLDTKIKNYEEDFENLYSPRVRLAPSPTGSPHLGTLRTAVYNYLFSQKYKGTLVLRIEDTDRSRNVEGASEEIVKQLRWAGIEWNEGFGTENQPHGPYVQSERSHIYRRYAQFLIDNGDAYRCFCTAHELNERRKENKNEALLYDRRCLYLTEEEINEKLERQQPYAVRLLVPKESAFSKDVTIWEDIIQGRIEFKNELIDDQVLLKSDGNPTYHLANVIDDHLMEITHVIRGKEWLNSTPKHLILYDKLGFKPPAFAHLPLILSPRGGKMSKREKEVSIRNFQIMGYNPDALVNSVALLGWRSQRHEKNPASLEQTESYYRAEYFSKKDLIEEFDLRRIGKNDVKMDHSRFIFLNGEHLRREYYFFNRKERGEVLQKFRADLAQQLPECKERVLKTSLLQMLEVYKIVLPRINFKWEMAQFSYFFTEPQDSFFKREIDELTDKAHKKWTKKLHKEPLFYSRILKEILELTQRAVRDEGKEFNQLTINQVISGYLYDRANQGLLKNEDVYTPLRIALTGYANGPSVGQISQILEYKTFSRRVREFVERLENKEEK